LYGLALFLAIVVQIATAIFVFFQLLSAAIDVAGHVVLLWPRVWPSLAWVVVLVIAVGFLVRVGRYLIEATWGLISTEVDPEPEQAEGVALQRDDHPEIYAVVEEVSRRVGAPLPDEIRISHRAECSATEFREFGVQPRRRLVVLLGLPNLTVLTVAELQVILAHELAHISLGDTRVEVFTFRLLAVLDNSLQRMGRSAWRWIDPLFWYYCLSRYMLLGLVAPVRRYQELRADALSAAAYGGNLAAHTLLKDWRLAHEFASTVAAFHAAHRSPPQSPHGETVFSRLAERWTDISRSGQDYLQRRLEEEERPSFWDTHPTVARRVRTMRRFPAAGGGDRRPARSLLPDGEALAQRLHGQVMAQ
jgi:Zn-dependent protease with chaperone function